MGVDMFRPSGRFRGPAGGTPPQVRALAMLRQPYAVERPDAAWLAEGGEVAGSPVAAAARAWCARAAAQLGLARLSCA